MVCEKCSDYFPGSIMIDNKKRNLKSRRFCFKCSPWGKHNTKSLDEAQVKKDHSGRVEPPHKECYLCKADLPIDCFYATKLRISSECKTCSKTRVNLELRARKTLLVQEAGGKCIKCGYDKCVNALSFHHRNPNEKSFQIGARLTSKIEILREEVKKCDLLCANCHAETHS